MAICNLDVPEVHISSSEVFFIGRISIELDKFVEIKVSWDSQFIVKFFIWEILFWKIYVESESIIASNSFFAIFIISNENIFENSSIFVCIILTNNNIILLV